MDNTRLRQLAGIEPLHEVRVRSEHEQAITYDGFKLEQEKEYEDDRWHIMHDVSKGGKHLAALDHSPREWIDDKTFKKYVEFYKKHGRFPNRDDFRTGQQPTSPLTNQQIQTLKEDVQPDQRHIQREQQLFADVKNKLSELYQFASRQQGEDYKRMQIEANNLIITLDEHLQSYE